MVPSCFSRRDASKDICFTLKGQGQSLTSDQGHVMTEIGHVAYQSMCLDKTNPMKPSPTFYVSLFNQELLTKTVCNSNDL